MRLSVLDLTPIPAGSSPRDALLHTLDLARHADSIGLFRYWLAEHHSFGGTASAAPEILIGQIAAITTSIRVGSGGMMLPNHSPLKVAEVFRLLHALFPGRIDLGLGRAPGTDPRTAAQLRRGARISPEDFPAMFDELTGFLDAPGTPRPPWSTATIAAPIGVPAPELWILASSEVGVAFAAERGLGLAFAHHFNPEDAVAMARHYRERFEPSGRLAAPSLILAVSAVCAATDEEATRLSSSSELGGVRFAQGVRDLPMPSVEEALSYRYDEEQESLRALHRTRHIVGSAARVAARLRELAEACGAGEVMVQTHVHDPAARRRSYSLLAEALGVSRPAQ